MEIDFSKKQYVLVQTLYRRCKERMLDSPISKRTYIAYLGDDLEKAREKYRCYVERAREVINAQTPKGLRLESRKSNSDDHIESEYISFVDTGVLEFETQYKHSVYTFYLDSMGCMGKITEED